MQCRQETLSLKMLGWDHWCSNGERKYMQSLMVSLFMYIKFRVRFMILSFLPEHVSIVKTKQWEEERKRGERLEEGESGKGVD